MSGQENRSSKRVQGIAASPPLPLVTKRNKIPNRSVEEEEVDIRITAEESPRRKYGFNSQAGKRQPPNNQGAAASAETDARAAQRHSIKVEDHKDKTADSQIGDTRKEKLSPIAKQYPKKTNYSQIKTFFSPVLNAEFQPEDERDEDELWNERTAEYHPATGDADLSYRQLSSESDKESYDAEGGEDAADWMDRYEVLADYNRLTDADTRANFGIYLEGPARQWFQCLTPPNG
ncbi:hypothetical protein OUZ56_026503 [Daphnia magna]|uniref:Uncharacterized protein n=1 Tax=Daphnia magna TaxID=35525 RepID=A0ABQ9ZLY2_9CRUS|nr:hypothetical protein OUZ56_026503 [Daphnia magna]